MSTRRPSKFCSQNLFTGSSSHTRNLAFPSLVDHCSKFKGFKFIYLFVYVCMCARVCSHACAHTQRHMLACVWKSEYGYQELLFSFHYKESLHPMFPCGKNSLNVPFLAEPSIIFSDKSRCIRTIFFSVVLRQNVLKFNQILKLKPQFKTIYLTLSEG